MLIIGIVLLGVLRGTDDSAFIEPTIPGMTLRLLCCYLFHLENYKDVASSFKRLKYLRYHPEKFDGELLNAAFVITVY